MTRPAPTPGRPPLAPVPTLDELAADPAAVAGLPLDAAATLLGRVHVLEGTLFARLVAAPSPAAVADGDRALGLKEAAEVLGMKPATLYRKWPALGIGYRDADGRVKFTRDALQRYLARRAGPQRGQRRLP